MLNDKIISDIAAVTGGSDTAYQEMDGMLYPVRILDAKQAYGRIDVLVTPVGGQGERWVRLATLKKTKEEGK